MRKISREGRTVAVTAVLLVIGIAVLGFLLHYTGSNLYISEVCSHNDEVMHDSVGFYKDFIVLNNSSGYPVNLKGYVTAKNRVACRRWVDGPQAEINGKPSWLVNGSEVKIFYMSEEWACTSRGYIKSEWLEVCAE